MYLKPSTIYGSVVPRAEYIRALVRQGTVAQAGALAAFLIARKLRRRV